MNQARTVGGIGAILLLLSFVPSVGGLLSMVGFVMILVAVKAVSDALGDKRIFTDMTIAVILGILGIVAGAFVVLAIVLSGFASGYFGTGPAFAPSASVTTGQWIAFGTTIGLGLVGAWVFLVASSVYLRRTYTAMGAKLGIRSFDTAGTLYLTGTATAVVLVGFLPIFVAQIMTAIAFWSIPETKQQQLMQIPNPPITTSAWSQVKGN